MDPSASAEAVEMFTLALRAEEAVRDLYLACVGRWPEERAFWEPLAEQECHHVEGINQVLELIRRSPGQFRVIRRLDPVLFRAFVSYAERELRDLEAGETSLDAMLDTARDIEQSLVEFDYPTFVTSGVAEYEVVARRITTDTLAHRHRIMRKIADRRKVK